MKITTNTQFNLTYRDFRVWSDDEKEHLDGFIVHSATEPLSMEASIEFDGESDDYDPADYFASPKEFEEFTETETDEDGGDFRHWLRKKIIAQMLAEDAEAV